MERLFYSNAKRELLLDCSEDQQVRYWADKFGVTPQVIKGAVRACCDNNILRIKDYLKSKDKYLTSN